MHVHYVSQHMHIRVSIAKLVIRGIVTIVCYVYVEMCVNIHAESCGNTRRQSAGLNRT